MGENITELNDKIEKMTNDLAYLHYRRQHILDQCQFKISIYKRLKKEIKFHGIQYDQGQPVGILFSDRQTGSSFWIDYGQVNFEQAILDRLKTMRKIFQETKKNVANQTK